MFSKSKLIASALTLSLVTMSVAQAADVNLTSQVTVSVGGLNLTLVQGSTATSYTVGSSTLSVTTVAGETFSVISADRYTLSTDSDIAVMVCNDSVSRVTVSGDRTVVITPSSTVCTTPTTSGVGGSSSSGGGGGGGGGGGASVTPKATVFDVPDTGKVLVPVAVVDTSKKIELSIAKNTSFKTDVKKEKKVKYTDTIAAPTFVESSSVAAKSIPKNTSVVLAVQADTSKQVKLSRPAVMSIPLSADALKLKLKAYYINENTGRARYVVGGKINKATNSFVARVKNLGGVLILVQKTPKK